MSKRKKKGLPFDRRGGQIVLRVEMLGSEAYLSLSPQAKVLMTLMHIHWRNYEPVAYGVREAQKKIPCCRKKAMNAFAELQKYGFIEMVDESLFNSRTQSRARTWKLTWLPYMDKFPTNDWEKAPAKINSTGLFPILPSGLQVSDEIPLKKHRESQVSKVIPLS